MILFVFEGKRREPDIFKTLEYLYFPKGQSIICSFGNNIYELYRELKDLDDSGDIVSILREKNKDNPDTPKRYRMSISTSTQSHGPTARTRDSKTCRNSFQHMAVSTSSSLISAKSPAKRKCPPSRKTGPYWKSRASSRPTTCATES